MGGVPNRIRQIDEAAIRSRSLQAELGSELRAARLARGLRQIDVARAINGSGAQVSRVEHALVPNLAVADLARHGAVVGLRLSVRFYPTGGGLRDEAQLSLLRRLRARIGDEWTWRLEAPLNLPGDRRAFDALLTNERGAVAVEAITRLHDAQAQLRALTLKQRDGGVGRLVLVVGASHANRRALASVGGLLATSFPLGTRATLAALERGQAPSANGIVLL